MALSAIDRELPAGSRLMAFIPAGEFLGAAARVRTLTLRGAPHLPDGQYTLINCYCADPACDCRKTMIQVFTGGRCVSIINYGWASAAYYAAWYGSPLDAQSLSELQGPSIDLGSPDLVRRDAMLAFFRDICDENYRQHLLYEYVHFKAKLNEQAAGGTPQSARERLGGNAIIPATSQAPAAADRRAREAAVAAGGDLAMRRCGTLRSGEASSPRHDRPRSAAMDELSAAETPRSTGLPARMPEGFDHQIDRVNVLLKQAFALATRDEVLAAARTMGMLEGDRTVLSSDEGDNARLVEWTTFHIRRDGKTLVQVLLDRMPPETPSPDRVILGALVDSRWSIFRIEAARTDVGVVTLDVWGHAQRVVFSRTLPEQVGVGDMVSGRVVTVGDLSTLTALIVPVPPLLLEGLRHFQEQGSLPSDDVLARDPVWQERLGAKMFTRHRPDPPVSLVRRGGNRDRNRPCPCGSGRKYKRCCGRGG